MYLDVRNIIAIYMYEGRPDYPFAKKMGWKTGSRKSSIDMPFYSKYL
jgi:hypothetical protein